MKAIKTPGFCWFIALALMALSQPCCVLAQGTAFTYQGRLDVSGSPANGLFDFRFRVDEDPQGNTIRATVVTNAVPVTNGLFAVILDFGAGVFTGSNYWLEIDVTTNLASGYTILNPLQPLTPAPYAIFANTASNVLGTISGAQISGPVPSASLTGTYASALTLNNTGNSFTGNGANLKSLNASQLTTGTVADARLSTNVALLNASQIFGGANNFNNPANNFTGNGASISNVTLGSLSATSDISWGNFELSSSPSTGSLPGEPFSVAAADVNGDGKLDLISANSYTNTLTVLTNNGSGGFVLSSTLNVGKFPQWVIAADVNGDGFVDLICANAGTNTLTVLTNNGSGGFTVSSSPVVGNGPFSVVAADVNGDGFVDLISANGNTNTLTVLTNNGHGKFVTDSTLTVALTAGEFPADVCAADVNGDGFVDLICAINGFPGSLTIFTNNGHGVFANASTVTVGNDTDSVIAADVNGDGFVDLICANFSDETMTVVTNNGKGGFVFATTLNVGGGPNSVAAADVYRNGNLDLISANEFSDSLTVWSNNGSGGFATSSTIPVGSGPVAVIAADVNGDGEPDLISANGGDTTLSVVLNTPVFSPGISNTYAPTIGDGQNNFGLSTQSGYYTTVGNLVYFEVFLIWANTGVAVSTDNLQISLPLPIASKRADFTLGFLDGINYSTQLVGTSNSGQSFLGLDDLSKTGARPSAITVGDCNATGEIHISGLYRWR